MLYNLDPASQRFLVDLNRIQTNSSIAQQQLSSGFKVQSASDAPDQIGVLLQLESQKSANTQTLSNLGRVQTATNAADDTLNTAVLLTDKITQLAGQGLSSNSAQERTIYAQQIQDLQQQLVALTGATVEGKYIFDGGDGTTQPYQYNTTTNSAVRLSSTHSTAQVQDPDGSTFAIAISAQDIFDQRDSSDNPTANNIFAAVSQTITALNANDTTGISTAIDTLHGTSTYLRTQESYYGFIQDHLANAITASQSLDVSLKSQISAIRDADSVEASLTVSRGNIQEQAALAAEAKTQTKTLFDYLA